MSYLEQFVIFLFEVSKSWNGTAGPITDAGTQEGKLGTERFQCNTTRVVTLSTFYQSLKRFKETVISINWHQREGGTMSQECYNETVRRVIKELDGVGILLGQKILHCCMAIGLVQDNRLLDYPTTHQTFERPVRFYTKRPNKATSYTAGAYGWILRHEGRGGTLLYPETKSKTEVKTGRRLLWTAPILLPQSGRKE